MAAIPGWAYLGAGLLITVYSEFLLRRGAGTVLRLFFWVGVLLLIIGVFKQVATYILTKGKSPRRSSSARSPPIEGLRCSGCRAKLHPKSRYCNWCGAKVIPSLR